MIDLFLYLNNSLILSLNDMQIMEKVHIPLFVINPIFSQIKARIEELFPPKSWEKIR